MGLNFEIIFTKKKYLWVPWIVHETRWRTWDTAEKWFSALFKHILNGLSYASMGCFYNVIGFSFVSSAIETTKEANPIKKGPNKQWFLALKVTTPPYKMEKKP